MTTLPPFTVLHVCMGNICRSPMAERLLSATVDRLGGADQVYVHSAGTGGWHAGESMDPGAARQVLAQGGTVDGFRARQRAERADPELAEGPLAEVFRRSAASTSTGPT